MNNDEIKSELRSILEKIVDKEKERVRSNLDDFDEKITKQKEKMAPIILTLNSLKEELTEADWFSIRPAAEGNRITVEIKNNIGRDSYDISTIFDNTEYQAIHTSSSNTDYSSNKKYFDTAEEVIKMVLEVVGKHMGAQQAYKEGK